YFSAMATASLSRVGRKLDVVVVGIYTDLSIGDIPRIAAVDRYGDQVIFDQIAVSRRTYEALMMSRWRRLAVSANTTMRRLSSTYNRIFPPRASSKFAVPMTHAPDGALEIWRERVLANLHALSAATKLPPSRLIVWLIPSNHDLHSIWQAGRTGSAVPDYVQRADRFWTETARRFSFAEFEMVDARNVIQQLFLNEGRYPYSVSGHFRPIAYRTVAQLIVPRVALALGNHQTYP
ncbi:MAG TPA: hypothetical protein VJ834_03530, partial [Burkholderiales bacterium]|nr:hypothetical protein [Burkholderiales bacterium]